MWVRGMLCNDLPWKLTIWSLSALHESKSKVNRAYAQTLPCFHLYATLLMLVQGHRVYSPVNRKILLELNRDELRSDARPITTIDQDLNPPLPAASK